MSTLEIKNISIDAGEQHIVLGVSLSLSSGEMHVLMGQNGSGKSTLVNALLGHPRFQVREGQVFFDGEDVTALTTEEKAKRGMFLSMQYLPEIAGVTLLNLLYRAYMAQKGGEMTVLDFYRYAEARAVEAGLDASFLKRPVGAGLSGGEKKQAEILQMVILEPKFAFLDEVDSGVDVDAMKKVLAGIQYILKKGTGVMLITHYDTILKDITPDHVHVMKEGKLLVSGDRTLAERIRDHGFSSIAE